MNLSGTETNELEKYNNRRFWMEVADGQPTTSGTGKRTIIQDTERWSITD